MPINFYAALEKKQLCVGNQPDVSQTSRNKSAEKRRAFIMHTKKPIAVSTMDRLLAITKTMSDWYCQSMTTTEELNNIWGNGRRRHMTTYWQTATASDWG